MRLMCDEMLRGLGRWLRAAGYDTAIARNGIADDALLALCFAESRLLLTRDRALAEAAERRLPVLRVTDDAIDAQARQLRAALALDWLHAPFTRCLLDNAPLAPAGAGDAAAAPEAARRVGGPLRRCPCCGRLYWMGGHVRRMQARLARWQAEPPGPT